MDKERLKIRIAALKLEASRYFSTPDLPGSEAAGADSNHELGMVCLEEAEFLERQLNAT